MGQQPIDYDALAAQHGGTATSKDYDAIASSVSAPKNGEPNDLPWYSDPTSGAYGKFMDSVIDHLPILLGGAGGAVGGAGGTVAGFGIGGPPGAIGGAGLGGAAGEAFKELINRARGKKAPTTSGEAVQNIAANAAAQSAAQATGEVVGPLMTSIGERVMQSAVKPGMKILLKTPPGQTPQVVKTLLDEGVNVTPNGVRKLQTLVSATNDEIDAALAPHASTEIPALKVAGRLNDVAKQYSKQVNPQADLAAISQVGENFLDNPAVSGASGKVGGGTITIGDAQAMKRGTYQQIGKSYGQPNANATIAAEKALARGLKEDIAAEVPDISNLNAREGKLLEALSVTGKRVALAGNRDPVGFAWVTHNPSTFLAALIDRSPAVKSMLARGLYNAAGSAAKVSPQLIRGAMMSLVSEDPASASSSGPGNQ